MRKFNRNQIHEEIILAEANYIIDNKATIRATATHFRRSKSTVHYDMKQHLPKFNHTLAAEVEKVIKVNLAERASRGGSATKHKHMKGDSK